MAATTRVQSPISTYISKSIKKILENKCDYRSSASITALEADHLHPVFTSTSAALFLHLLSLNKFITSLCQISAAFIHLYWLATRINLFLYLSLLDFLILSAFWSRFLPQYCSLKLLSILHSNTIYLYSWWFYPVD